MQFQHLTIGCEMQDRNKQSLAFSIATWSSIGVYSGNLLEMLCALMESWSDVLVNDQTGNDDKCLWYHAISKVCCVKGIENLSK